MGTFDRQRYAATEDHLWREVWLREAERGHIWFPQSVDDTWAQTLSMVLYGLRTQDEIRLFIDCEGGQAESFAPCRELWWRWQHRGEPDPSSSRSPYARVLPGLATISCVTGKAHSIGLSYSVCATHRQAVPEARFMVHGEPRRHGPLYETADVILTQGRGLCKPYLEDHYVADWLAKFTKRTYLEWLCLVSDGQVHEFGVAEALEWGVIDEVLEGV